MEGDVHDTASLMPTTLDLDAKWRLQAALEGLGGELASQRSEREHTFRVLAGLQVHLGRIGDALRSQLDHLRSIEADRREAVPIFHNFATSGLAPTNGPLVLNCGGPAIGRCWHVKRLVVGGLTLATTANGSAEIYVSGWIPDAETVGTSGVSTPSSLSDLVDATILISSPQTNLPNIGNYDDGQVYVRPREKLWVVIRSGTAGQQYVAAGTAKDVALIDSGQ